jgi:rhodanese-related sulfurtransferase
LLFGAAAGTLGQVALGQRLQSPGDPLDQPDPVVSVGGLAERLRRRLRPASAGGAGSGPVIAATPNLAPSRPWRPNERRRDRILVDIPLGLLCRAGVAAPPCFFFDTPSRNSNTSISLSSGNRRSLLMAPWSFPSVVAKEIRPPDDALLVVYCHHGIRSLSGAAILEQHGFANVVSLAGGIDAWSLHIDPKVPRY